MTVGPSTVIYLHVVLPKHGGEQPSTVDRARFLTGEMTGIEVKAFVPARDFDQSEQFYQHLGFELAWSDGSRAHFRHGDSSFLLQKIYNKERVDHVVMHLLVVDVEAWWQHIQAQDLKTKYQLAVDPPEDRPWGIRDFRIVDPSGVLWRIGQTTVKEKSAACHTYRALFAASQRSCFQDRSNPARCLRTGQGV